jgi:hypothetical protein
LTFTIVVIGGANLVLRGLTSRRTTRDVDVLGERVATGIAAISPIPAPLSEAIEDVGRRLDLSHTWLNTGRPNC